MITLFDIPSTLPSSAWSPNTWITRLCLNHKGLEYKTEWVEYPDIAHLCEERGIKPTTTWPDGSPMYTLPAIIDEPTKTKRIVTSDSFDIARYLDEEYPDTKHLLPPAEEAQKRQRAFPAEFRQIVIFPLKAIYYPRAMGILNPVSQPHYSHARARVAWGKESLEEIHLSEEEKKRLWEEFRRGLSQIDVGYYGKTDDAGPWIEGEEITYGDLVVVAFLISLNRVFGDDSPEWKELRTWDNGRWAGLYDAAENPIRM